MTLIYRKGKHNLFQKLIWDPIVAFVVAILFYSLKILPVSWARWLGEKLGGGIYYIAHSRNKIALVNLNIAFPEKTLAEKKEIIKKMWRHFGGLFAETPHASSILKRIDMVGEEYFRQAKEGNTGGFICTAHLGNWEIANIFSEKKGLVLNTVYRKANNSLLEKLLFKKRPGVLIPKGAGGARLMIELLRKKEFIAMLCDQKLRQGIWVPFFGEPAQTVSAIAALSLKMNVPIFLAKCIRKKNGRFEITMYPPLKIKKTGDMDKDIYQVMLTINQTFEEWIRETPEQWLWIHRRFPKEIY